MKQQYQDRLFGPVIITESVTAELIASPTLQRLSGISQAGYFEGFFPGSFHSRFEHSVGVYLLLQHYGAPFTEQIAGLLHDISHTAFSHAIDYALPEGTPARQSYQDDTHAAFFWQSECPSILSRYGIDPDLLLDASHFPLLEQPAPGLCADRIDYCLRDGLSYGIITKQQADYFLAHLGVYGGTTWVFDDQESAEAFAAVFTLNNRFFYADLSTAAMFASLGHYLKRALRLGIITREHLYLTDNEVMHIIAAYHSTDPELAFWLNCLQNKIAVQHDPNSYDIEIICKSRAIDPAFLVDGIVTRLSGVKNEWKTKIDLELKPKRFFLKYTAGEKEYFSGDNLAVS